MSTTPTLSNTNTTPEPLLGLRAAMKFRGCKSPVTIWNNIRKGTFPAPDTVLNNVRLWRQSTLKNWQDELTNQETGQQGNKNQRPPYLPV